MKKPDHGPLLFDAAARRRRRQQRFGMLAIMLVFLGGAVYALGYDPGEYGVYDFEVETSTHYGRMVRLDDKVLIFANPEDAAEYLGFAESEAAPA